MSDPPLSDINFKNKMAWVLTTLKTIFFYFECSKMFHMFYKHVLNGPKFENFVIWKFNG